MVVQESPFAPGSSRPLHCDWRSPKYAPSIPAIRFHLKFERCYGGRPQVKKRDDEPPVLMVPMQTAGWTVTGF